MMGGDYWCVHTNTFCDNRYNFNNTWYYTINIYMVVKNLVHQLIPLLCTYDTYLIDTVL